MICFNIHEVCIYNILSMFSYTSGEVDIVLKVFPRMSPKCSLEEVLANRQTPKVEQLELTSYFLCKQSWLEISSLLIYLRWYFSLHCVESPLRLHFGTCDSCSWKSQMFNSQRFRDLDIHGPFDGISIAMFVYGFVHICSNWSCRPLSGGKSHPIIPCPMTTFELQLKIEPQ